MTTPLHASLERLARANPVPVVDPDLGRDPGAQAQLAAILATGRDAPRRHWRPRRRRATAVLILAALLAGCGALRVADPFGFWRSGAPGTASYGVNPAHRVNAPHSSQLVCGGADLALTCSPNGGGQRYERLSQVEAQAPSIFARAKLLSLLAHAVRTHETSVAAARRLRADLAAVPDSFFAALRELFRFQTLTSGAVVNGTELVPPHGLPALIACQQDGAAIACRNLNGDEQVPVGSGIYSAVQASDWKRVRAPSLSASYAAGERLVVAVLGHPFTPAELRFINDLARGVGGQSSTTTGGLHSSRPARVSVRVKRR